jgi:hypothetical protein
MNVPNQNLAAEEEAHRYRRMQFLMDLALMTIAQSDMTYDDAVGLVQSAKQAALRLFPGTEDKFDLIYLPRFRRVIAEKFKLD